MRYSWRLHCPELSLSAITQEYLNLISAMPYHVIITYRQLDVGKSGDEGA
jgi:hypothetical protein